MDNTDLDTDSRNLPRNNILPQNILLLLLLLLLFLCCYLSACPSERYYYCYRSLNTQPKGIHRYHLDRRCMAHMVFHSPLQATGRSTRPDTDHTKTDHYPRHHFRTLLAAFLALTPRLFQISRYLSSLWQVSDRRWNSVVLFRCNIRTLPLNPVGNKANRLERLFSSVVLDTTNFSVHTCISKASPESCMV